MDSSRIKIVFVLPSLKAGGAERVVSFISQNLDKTKFLCTLLVAGRRSDCVYPIDDVKVVFFEKGRVLNAIPELIKELLKRKPDLLFGSIGHINIVLGLIVPFLSKTKVVARMASVSTEIAKFSASNKFYSFLDRFSVKNITHFICQSHDMKLDFQKISPNIPDSRISIINNPITGHFKLKSPKEKANGVREFITVGRLNKEKGHERLLNILAKYDKPFHYTIIGDGPLKDQLFKQIDELHLTDKVKYINFTKDVEAYLSKSDLFLQGSFVEGFPNALLESCAVGTPAIAFNAPGGTKEIIEHGVNGFLAGTEEEFLAYLKESRPLEAQKIKSSVEAKFSQEHIIRKYETLFFELMKN